MVLPPPPPPPKDGSKPKPLNIDSLKKVKVKIVVDTLMFETKEKVKLPNRLAEFQDMVDIIPTLHSKSVKTEFVSSKKGHHLIFGNSLNDFEGDYSQIISISRIVFNDKTELAVVYAGHATHPLAGYVKLYLLKKINGTWQIIYNKRVSAS